MNTIVNHSEPPSLAFLEKDGIKNTQHTNIKGVMKELDSVSNQIYTLNQQKKKLDKHKKMLEIQILEWLKNAKKMEVVFGENIYFIDYREKRKTIQKKHDKQEKRQETIETLRNSGVDDKTLKNMFENGLEFKFQDSVECLEQLKIKRIKN